MTDICILINENSNGLQGQFNNVIDTDSPVNLKIVLNSYENKMDLIEDKLVKLNLINFNISKLSSLSLINTDDNITIMIIELITVFLSYMPYDIEKIKIELSNIDINISKSDPYYSEFMNDYDFRISHFFSKQKNSCKKLCLSMNYLFSKSIRELENYTKLEKIELNLYSVGCQIGKTLKKIIRNNYDLNSICFNLIGINNDDLDMNFWFLSLCEEIDEHLNIKNIRINWMIENINEYNYEDNNLIFQKLINKYHIIESLRKLLNKSNVDNLYIHIYTPYKEINKFFDNIFNEINTKIKHKRKYDRIN